MARPLKQGLDYFPMNVDIDQDDKIQMIEALHGPLGFTIIIKLYAKIYKEGYFYKWGDYERLLFSKRLGVDNSVIKDVVNDCIKYGVFEKNMFKKYNILTSNGLQKRYFEAIQRRKDIIIDERFILINGDLGVNVNNKSVNDNISTQSKVKKRKVKENKIKYGEFVSLTASEYEKLVQEHGELKSQKMIELLDNYKGSTGKKYVSDYRTILGWVLKTVNEESVKISQAIQTPLYKPAVVDLTKGEE